MPRSTAGERLVRVLGPFSPAARSALVRAIATKGNEVDPMIAPTYVRFLHYASRTEDPITFLLEVAACLQGGITRALPTDPETPSDEA